MYEQLRAAIHVAGLSDSDPAIQHVQASAGREVHEFVFHWSCRAFTSMHIETSSN
jgi:hypothetical protein